MEPSNEELIQACRRGDAAAWEALIARYQRLVYSIPRRAGLDGDRSAEVFQRVFGKLVEHLDRIEQPEQIGAWLATTARREMWRLRQQEGAAQSLSEGDDSDDETNQLPDDAPLPDEVLLRLEEQHTVRLAVATLDERCHRLLTLLFYRPDSPAYAEIAAALEMSEGSIGPTRIRCLQKLRRLLDSLGCFLMYFSVSEVLF
jgi:RNA polymerase sigma factor (sigma-70 family)